MSLPMSWQVTLERASPLHLACCFVCDLMLLKNISLLKKYTDVLQLLLFCNTNDIITCFLLEGVQFFQFIF